MLQYPSTPPLLMSLVLMISTLNAQRPAPFETVEIGLGILPVASENILDGFWQQNTGYTMNMQTPFYWGILDAGVDLLSLNPTIDAPSISVLTPWLGLSARWDILSNMALGVGTKLGISRFSFTGISGYSGDESEVMAGISVSADYRFLSRWSVQISIRHDVIFTSRRIGLSHYRAGLAYKIASPAWLREFLR